MIKPVTPKEIMGVQTFPDEVIESFNQLIRENFRSGVASIKQADALKLICHKMKISREEIFEKRYLDVESIFRAAGWIVEYHKPGWNETHHWEPFFTFRLKNNTRKQERER